MPARLRILGFLYRICLALGDFRWGVPIFLGVAALVTFGLIQEPLPGMVWALAAALTTLLLVGGEIQSYAIFVPDRTSPSPKSSPPSFLYGVATGTFRVWDHTEWHTGEREYNLPVQVRWLPGETPPTLALLAPNDLPEQIKEPLDEAEVLSLWCPGVEATTGRYLLKGRFFPALRLRFAGRQVMLALQEESAAAALAAALRAEGWGESDR